MSWWGETVQLSEVLDTIAGPVRGRLAVVDGRDYCMYKGIPFAEPPVGELRFKKPVPVQPWCEIKDCLDFGPRCPQHDTFVQYFMNNTGMDEAGCLNLNIFTPKGKSENWPDGYPVMVWIHGGGFSIHSASNYGDHSICRNLCSNDVIVVTIQYRLGAFGFAVTGEECKGNLGLWDQTLALQFVHDNIGVFGGDPDNVTVFGQSAGGASTSLLALSPHSRDLFRRAICMSGCANNLWAIRTPKMQKELTELFATEVGWNGTDNIYTFLRTQPTAVLQRCIRHRVTFAGQLVFCPNIDGDFFPKPLAELREEAPGKTYMIGSTSHEGLFFHAIWGLTSTIDQLRTTVRNACATVDGHRHDDAWVKEVIDFYTLGKGVDLNDKQQFAQMFVEICSDMSVNNGISQGARKLVEEGNDVYLYSYDYCNHNNFGLLKYIMPFTGPTHCSEIRYVMGKGIFSKFRPNEADVKMLNFTTRLWTNFAKYGNPKPAPCAPWDPLDEDKMNFYRIDEVPHMCNDFRNRCDIMWRKGEPTEHLENFFPKQPYACDPTQSESSAENTASEECAQLIVKTAREIPSSESLLPDGRRRGSVECSHKLSKEDPTGNLKTNGKLTNGGNLSGEASRG